MRSGAAPANTYDQPCNMITWPHQRRAIEPGRSHLRRHRRQGRGAESLGPGTRSCVLARHPGQVLVRYIWVARSCALGADSGPPTLLSSDKGAEERRIGADLRCCGGCLSRLGFHSSQG